MTYEDATEFIVVWKDAPGQQVSTTVDSDKQPIVRDKESCSNQNAAYMYTEQAVLHVLEQADGRKIAVPLELARATLGWDI